MHIGRLAGENRAIQRAATREHITVDGNRLAGMHTDHAADLHRVGRHIQFAAIRLHQSRRGRREGEQLLGGIGGGALTTRLQEASHEQQEHQCAHPIEIDGTRPADGVDRATRGAGGQCQRDRHVHVHRAGAQCGPRADEEHAAGPQQGGDGEAQAEPAEERQGTGVHGVQLTGVQRQRDEHDVRGNGTGDADAHEHRAILTLAQCGPLAAAIGMRRVAQRVERACDVGELRGTRVPCDGGARLSHVELRACDTAHQQRHALDEPDARGAMHALECERDVRHAVDIVRDVA